MITRCLLLSVLFLMAVACKDNGVKPNIKDEKPEVQSPCSTCEVAEEGPREVSIPIGPEYPIKYTKPVFTVKIKQTNYNENQIQNLKMAEKAIEQVIASDRFKEEMLKKRFSITPANMSNKTALDVYEHLYIGAEALMPAMNYQLDLTVTMYNNRISKVIGYTTANSLTVYTNAKFHNHMSVCEIASNLYHEWTHKMGYDHVSASDYSSVPYASGYLIRDLCLKPQKI